MGILDQKVVIVAGGGRGVGRECALLAAREGAAVLINDFGGAVDGGGASAGPARAVAEEIRAAGGVAAWNAADIADPKAVQAMIDQALGELGGLHAIVNPAGILRDKSFREMSQTDWSGVIATHLTGAFNLCHASIGHFAAQGDGVYILFTSTSGLIGHATQANYAAAKMGVVGLSRIIAMEEGANNIRSMVIAPFAWTRMMEAALSARDESEAQGERRRRSLRAEQVAQLAIGLCAPQASGFSGEILGVRGNEIFLFGQPRPVRSLARTEGWTPATILSHALPSLSSHRTGLGGSTDYFTWDPI